MKIHRLGRWMFNRPFSGAGVPARENGAIRSKAHIAG
jgi:hypothetical protein